MSLSFEPLLPPTVWITLCVFCVATWVWYARSRPATCRRNAWWTVMGLAAVAMACVMTVLLNPVWLEPLPPPPGKPLLTVVIDQSASMQTTDAAGQGSRFQQATKALTSLQQTASETFDIRYRAFGGESRATTLEELQTARPDGNVSNLADPVIDALSSDQPQGQAVLLISDGVHNATLDPRATLEAAEIARSRDAPVYTLAMGAATQVDDVEIRLPRSQELAFAGQTIPVLAEVVQHGDVAPQATVHLRDPDGDVQTQQVTLRSNGDQSVTFLLKPPGVGLYQYQLDVEPLPGEATPDNNATSFQVRVVDKPLKALVLEGKPYWDGKFLLRTLADDPSLEVDSLVRLGNDRFLQRKLKLVDSTEEPANGDSAAANTTDRGAYLLSRLDETPPAAAASRFRREEETQFVTDLSQVFGDLSTLSEYRILLLGREAESYLSPAAVESVRQWVAEQGGSLVCYRGSPVAEPSRMLSRLLPVKWAAGRSLSGNEERFRIQVTERGDDLSWLQIGGREGLTKLPSLARSGATDAIKPLAVVLGRGNDAASPVLTYQPYGIGRVVVVEGSGMWRWAFLPPEHREMDAAYGNLWQSLLRWLSSSGGLLPGEDIALQMDRVQFTAGEPISAVILRRPERGLQEAPNVLLYQGDRQLRSIQPTPVGMELGVYQVFIGGLETGAYRMELGETEDRVGTQKIHFNVQPDMREQLDVAVRSDVMQGIASSSGGDSLTLETLASLTDRYTQHVEKSRPVQYRRRPAWDRWWVLLGVFGLWTASWTLRRRTGLV